MFKIIQSFKNSKSIKVKFFNHSLLRNCFLLLIPIMIIGPYSIFKSSLDTTEAIEKSSHQILKQFDSTVETLYSHMDNANLFFASNPRVTIQMEKAFNEKLLSLDSLKNIQNLSLYFQNLIYTDPYIENIYVYYDNTNQRIYTPIKGAMQTISTPDISKLVSSYRNSNGKEFWMEVMQGQPEYAKTPAETLYIFQKLYTRSTPYSTGVIIFQYNLSKLEQEFQSCMQYSDQTFYVIDSDGQMIITNSSTSKPSAELTSLMPILNASEEKRLYNVQIDGTDNKVAYLKSKRNNGLTYITFLPAIEIYKTTRSLSETYILLTCLAVVISLILAFYKTNREYGYLNNIIEIFSNPDTSYRYFKNMSSSTSNPFEFIMLNVIRLFMKDDYLKMQASEREYKLQVLKMQVLQYQINPHFLHNTLNTIYWEAVRLTSCENSCSTMVSDLSSIIRYSLSSPQENVKISDEIKYLKTYMDIMKIRYPNKFDVQFQIDPACVIYPMRKMILQPLVENSIYHGIKEKSGRGTIHIGARLLKNSILIYILDNGKGISTSKLLSLQKRLSSDEEIPSNHVGLISTNLRLKFAYGKKHLLHIKSHEGKFTIVYFRLPLSEASDNRLASTL